MLEDSRLLDIPADIARRRLLQAAVVAGAAGTLAQASTAQNSTTVDTPLLNFSLNLSYLMGQYLCVGLWGASLDPARTRGPGINPAQPGAVTGGRKLSIADPITDRVLKRVQGRNDAQIDSLRGILFSNLVQQPALDISAATFTTFMQTAGAVPAGTTFDPYASADNFLLGAYVISDTLVTAQRYVAANISNEIARTTMLALMSARAAGAGAIRALLYQRGLSVPAILAQADAISDQRDRYDGASDLDQGITPTMVAGQRVANIVPADGNALVPLRTPEQTLNVLYMTRSAASSGGFFPQGLTGTIRTSAAN